jgi:hypothetical protein
MTQAAPASSNLEARKSVNDCGDSTFENQSSSGSPLIADCQQITRNIAGTIRPPLIPYNIIHEANWNVQVEEHGR